MKQRDRVQAQILGEFLSLYEHNEIGHLVAKRNGKPSKVPHAYFAFLGSATREGFTNMWQGMGGAGSGLQSRFVLSYSERPMPSSRTPNDEQALTRAVADLKKAFAAGPPEIVLGRLDFTVWHDEVSLLLLEYDRRRFSRVLDMGKRFALVLAACNGEREVTTETLFLPQDFVEYQVKVCERLMPPDSTSHTKTFEDRIIDYYRKYPGRTMPQARNWIKPEKAPGGHGPFNRAFGNLTRAGRLRKLSESQKGNPRWQLDD